MNAADFGTGERLAAWLEDLGLVDQLAAAGLPLLARDGQGRATWSDPRTGEPLGTDQLDELDRLLHQDGSEPQHAVPVALLQLARQARLRETLLATRSLTYETLAELRRTSVDAARFWTHKGADDNRLLVVASLVGAETRTLVPAFQLTEAGDVVPQLAAVLTPLLAARMDPWRVWAWLTQPAALLGGLVPVDAAADPGNVELVAHAAVRLAERVANG